MSKIWKRAQEWEAKWHGNCINSFNEERKQLEYAALMGLNKSPTHKTPYNFDLNGKSILDIGGGAYSLLLKCTNFVDSVVIDPLLDEHPRWVDLRYETHGLECYSISGEKLDSSIIKDYVFDEVWFYNVLEHVYDPGKIVKNALAMGKIVRCFEWLYTPPNIGHPQTLTEDKMNEWLGGEGKITKHKRGNTIATSYSGIFKGNHYEEI